MTSDKKAQDKPRCDGRDDDDRQVQCRPLAGVRILEFEALGPVTYAGMVLGDMGADVVRIERATRAADRPRSISQRGRGSYLTTDLKDADDVERVLRLVASADALSEGFRPGVMERLGLGPSDLKAINPRLVYGRMTGWGQRGPLSERAGHDINYIAATGALHAIGAVERPAVPLNLVGDFGGGSMFLALGVVAGILSARSTGAGCVVDAAMCDGSASLMTAIHHMYATGSWSDTRRANLLDGAAPYYDTYACADGKFVAVGALEPQFFMELARQLGLDESWTRRREDRAHWPALRQELSSIFLRRTRDEWAALLEDQDVCVTPVLSIAESFEHTHLVARRTYVTVGGVVQAAPVPRFEPYPHAPDSRLAN